MRKKVLAFLMICALVVVPTFAHDLFLKLDNYFVAVNDKISIKILNGSFQTSEGAVNFARLKDVSVVSPAGTRTNPKETDFTKDDKTSFLNLQPTEEGNYVVGLSTMPREIDFVDAIMKRFGHKVEVMHEGMPAAIGVQAIVDLSSQRGLQYVARADLHEDLRLVEMTDLGKSLKRRIRKLAEGTPPAELDLPADWGAREAHDQLARLYTLWCEGGSTRALPSVPEETHAQLSFGLSETHFFMSGVLFEQPDVPRELTRQEMNDIKMFGKVSEATIRARYAEYNYGTESWGIIDETRGSYRLLRPANSSHSLAIGRILGVKVGKQDGFYLGVVRELVEDLDGAIHVTLNMMPGKPEATSVRGPDDHHKAGSYVQGFRLAPMPSLKIPETLVLPAGLAHVGRGIDIFHPGHGSPKEVRVVEFVERGADFDRVTIS